MEARVETSREIQLSAGTIKYGDTDGPGPVILFVHGLLASGMLWAPVVPLLAGKARCIVPELPLGAHEEPMKPDAELSPRSVARLIAEFMDKLDLTDVTLVGNDTGGALCQLVVTNHPERIGRLVLIDCDCFEHFPPPPFDRLVKFLARVPGAVTMLAAGGRLRTVRRASMAMAPLTVEPVPDELLASWVSPLRDRDVRRDLIKVLRAIDPARTMEAAEKLPAFKKPVLIAWGAEDKFFPFSDAERLAALFDDAQLERVDGARTFVQLDAPDRLAALIQGG
jgi:pimeloyl-ACP methyl ester carboxylesterase